jgi:hypothetical protein
MSIDVRHISENQDFIVPSDAPNGEYVGYVKAYPEFEMTGASPIFTLKTNVDNIYALDSSGLITISNNTSLNIGNDTIVVTISKTNFSSIDIDVSINCLNVSNCVFIDPAGSNGSGTRASPKNVFPTISSSTNYLLKRDSSIHISSRIECAYSKTSVIFGSYGTGAKPIIDSSSAIQLIWPAHECDDITIRDIHGTTMEPNKSDPSIGGLYSNWALCLFFESTTTTNFRVINCEMDHLYWGGCDNNGGCAEPVTEKVEYKWNYVHDICQDGLVSYGKEDLAGSTYAIANRIEKVQLGWNTSHSHAISAGDGMQIGERHEVYCRHNYIDASGVGGCCPIIVTSYNSDPSHWVEIFNNYLIGDTGGTLVDENYAAYLISLQFDYGKIYNNTFVGSGPYNWSIYAQAGNGNQVDIYNNIFRNVYGGIYGDVRSIYNNIFYGVGKNNVSAADNYIMRRDTTTPSFRNNIIYFTAADQLVYVNYEVATADIDYNLYNSEHTSMFWVDYDTIADMRSDYGKEMHSIVRDPLFESSINYNFHLQIDSSAIHAGTDSSLSLTTDFEGKSWSNPPSIGAYEYISDSSSAPIVTTTAVSDVSLFSAISGGNVTHDGSIALTYKGISWSTSINPTTADTSTTSVYTGEGSYISYLTPLNASTHYHIRAFAYNSQGTSYGIDVSFNTLSINASTYYISNSGNDVSNGLSGNTAWRTITKVNNTYFKPGSQVLFKCGDVWRETLTIPSSGDASNYITFGSYGTGNKPRILGSVQGINWTEVSTNKWKSDTSVADPYGGSYPAEIFFEELDGSINWGTAKKTYTVSLGNLTEEYDWTSDSSKIYVYAESNPITRYSIVEAPQRNYSINIDNKQYIIIDGLEIQFAKWNNIRTEYPQENTHGLTIKNCHISHVGSRWDRPSVGSYGYNLAVCRNDMLIQNNHIHDGGRRNTSVHIYGTDDISISNIIFEYNNLHDGYHSSGVGIVLDAASEEINDHFTNIIIRNNLIWDSSSKNPSVDGFATNEMCTLKADAPGCSISDVSIYNNIWKYVNQSGMWLKNVNNANIYNNTFYDHNHNIPSPSNMPQVSVDIDCTNIKIKNNIFYSKGDWDYQYGCFNIVTYTSPAEIFIDYNLFYQLDTHMGMVIVNDASYYRTDTPFSQIRTECGWQLHGLDPINPLFISEANLHLQSDSSAIHTGVYVGLLTDFDGSLWNNPPSIGAYEYSYSPETVPEARDVSINGTFISGAILTGSYTYYDAQSDPEGNSIYKWYRANTHSGTGEALISGESSTHYTLKSADASKYIAFEVTPISTMDPSLGTAVKIYSDSFVLNASVYYVSNDGSDNYSGLSDVSVWQSIAKVNGRTFTPGNYILFKCDDFWRETLTVPSSGDASNYITFSKYGTGNNPKVLGSNTTTWTLDSGNVWKSNSTFLDPNTIGYGDEIWFERLDGSISWGVRKAAKINLAAEYDYTWVSNYIYVYAATDPDSRYSSVEIGQRENAIYLNSKNYIKIDYVDLHYSISGVRGEYPVSGCTGLYVGHANMSHFGTIDGEGHSIHTCYSDSLFEYNTIHECGRRGISQYNYGDADISGIICQYNEMYDGHHTTGFDCRAGSESTNDGDLSNITIRNNLIWDEEDATDRGTEWIWMQGKGGDGGTGILSRINIYNNIFKYSTQHGIGVAGAKDVSIYNNVFYGHNTTIVGNTFHITIGLSEGGGEIPTGIKIKNNIFYSLRDTDTNGTGILISLSTGGEWVNVVADYNIYYRITGRVITKESGDQYYMSDLAALRSDHGWETHGMFIDPRFIDASANNYRLMVDSSAIHAGTYVGLTTDYAGSPWNNPPSIGAYEYSYTPPVSPTLYRYILFGNTSLFYNGRGLILSS